MNPATRRYGFWGVILFTGAALAAATIANRSRHDAGDDAADGVATTLPACCQAGVEESDLPVKFDVPDFSLTERSGATVTRESLKGKVWISDFMYTRCPGPCPVMTARMAQLAKDMGRNEDLRFVSFSVDPEYDTPEVLTAYAKKHEADPQGWLFLTGPVDTIRQLSVKGFRLALSTTSQPGADGPIIHSTRFSLIDRSGKIRGYYDAFDPKALDRLKGDARKLLEEKPTTAPSA